MLDALVRDQAEQDARDTTPDVVHDTVTALCRALRDAAQRISTVQGATLYMAAVPVARPVVIADCMACGQPALPRPRKGFCDDCLDDFSHRTKGSLPDRQAFIASVKKRVKEEANAA